MLGPTAFASFQQAYLAVLREVNTSFQYANAPRGHASRECIGMSFQLTDPRQRTLFLRARKVNPVYHVAEALWYLAGRRDLAMIGHYAPRRRADSRDGSTIDGGAYGARMLRSDAGGRPTIERVLDLVREETDSKRGVLPIFTADDLADRSSPDVPCAIALHVLLREGRLHMVCYMRANDTGLGLVADVYAFTLIQEFLAALLGAELGSYTHHVGSMHIGEKALPLVERILAEDDGQHPPRFGVPVMPDSDWSDIQTVLAHEELLRTDQARYTPEEIAQLGLAGYWQQVLLLFEAHRQIVRCPGQPVDAGVLDALDAGLRWQVEHRWPERIATTDRAPA